MINNDFFEENDFVTRDLEKEIIDNAEQQTSKK